MSRLRRPAVGGAKMERDECFDSPPGVYGRGVVTVGTADDCSVVRARRREPPSGSQDQGESATMQEPMTPIRPEQPDCSISHRRATSISS